MTRHHRLGWPLGVGPLMNSCPCFRTAAPAPRPSWSPARCGGAELRALGCTYCSSRGQKTHGVARVLGSWRERGQKPGWEPLCLSPPRGAWELSSTGPTPRVTGQHLLHGVALSPAGASVCERLAQCQHMHGRCVRLSAPSVHAASATISAGAIHVLTVSDNVLCVWPSVMTHVSCNLVLGT